MSLLIEEKKASQSYQDQNIHQEFEVFDPPVEPVGHNDEYEHKYTRFG
jgi:hypothetical protein